MYSFIYVLTVIQLYLKVTKIRIRYYDKEYTDIWENDKKH